MACDITSSDQLQGLVGKRFVHIYDSSWRYELYVKNADTLDTLDYRIHSGMVGGRWVKNQRVYAVWLGNRIYKISWDEPTGTSVSLAINLESRRIHGVIFFPKWVADDPKKTVCFQNQNYDEMLQYRDAGPTYQACGGRVRQNPVAGGRRSGPRRHHRLSSRSASTRVS